MQEIVTKFLEGDHEIYMKRIGTNTILQRLFHMEIKKQLKEKDMKYYYYLITFTLHPTVRKDEWEEVEKYILEQVKRPALKIVEAHYTKEFTKVGIPHWHVSVKATRYIAKNRFNYYVKSKVC